MSSKKCIICGYYSSRVFCHACADKARKYHETICEFLKNNYKPTVIDLYGATFIPLSVIYGLKEAGWVDIIPTGHGQPIVVSKR